MTAGAASEWDGHLLLLHAAEEERMSGVTAWVHRGLELGEKVIYTQDPATPAESLLANLEARGVSAAEAVRDGRLAVLPLAEFYPPEGQRVVVERALAEGFTAVRLSAEVRAAPTTMPSSRHRVFEKRMDELVRTHPVSALCQSSLSPATVGGLAQTVALHLTGVRQSLLTTGPHDHGIALRGEVDASNGAVLAAILAEAVARESRAMWLDLAAVTFVDAGACRHLAEATQAFRAAGGQLLLVAPSRMVERTMRLLGVDQLPGMLLVGGDR